MEKHLKTKAIVLKRNNYKEADRIITLFTEEKGKITTIAKGIRKTTSSKRGHLELFNLVDIEAVDHKGWYILTQAQSIETFSKIKEDLTVTAYAYYISEIFEKLVPEYEPNDVLFKLLRKTLTFTDKFPSLTLVNAFNLKLLKILGFYSRSQIKNLAQYIVQYLNEIEMSRYEFLSTRSYESVTEKQTHNFLRNFTESVLERDIKTQLDLR